VVWNLHRPSGTFEVFVDGELVLEKQSERKRKIGAAKEFLIGGAYGAGPLRRLVGIVDDYRIYSRKLSKREVAALP